MVPIKKAPEVRERFNRAKQKAPRREAMVLLCNDIYMMERNRRSTFLGKRNNEWRTRVPDEYWESSGKGQNRIDVMTAVLGGNAPQYKCTSPGEVEGTEASRAELFIEGAWRLNSRRQQVSLYHEAIFKTVKDGSCAIRVYWMPNPPEAIDVQVTDDPQTGEPRAIQLHDHNTFPICIEVVDINNIYTDGRGLHGRPFSELFYVQKRTAGDVIEEWEGSEGVDAKLISKIKKGIKPKDMYTLEEEYIEWWGQDAERKVWYAITFRDEFLVPPTKTDYPSIPFILTRYKSSPDPAIGHAMPFLYPIFHAIDRDEYTKSRSYRLVDLYSQMSPYHKGMTPLAPLNAAFGEMIELQPDEDIKFPNWPGQPPDIYKERQDLDQEIQEGSFSSALFGQIPGRSSSGYALSQVIGSDTLRGDTPKGNLELAFSAVADLIFGLLRAYSPATYISITMQVRNRKIAAMLCGEDTKGLIVETFVKPKQTSDEVRLATVGAQLSSLPNPPVSMRYILEHYFALNQPEEEMMRKLDEDAMKDPIIRMMAMVEVLTEQGSPFAQIMMAQLQQAMGQAMTPAKPEGPGSMPGVGMGLPQGVMGNAPLPGVGNPSEENGPTPEANVKGGPDYGS